MKKMSNRALSFTLAAGMLSAMLGAAPMAVMAESETEAETESETFGFTGDITPSVSEIKIGNVNPLSGDSALYGTDQQRGFNMALDEINAAGGVYGATLVLDDYDDQGDAQRSAQGAQKFADDEDYFGIIGSSLSNCTLAMTPIIDDAGIVEMVVSSSSPSLHGCSDYFFRMAVQDDQVGPQMGKAILDKGYTQIEILYPNNDFGINLDDKLEAYLKDNGGTVVNAIDYNASDQDFTAICTTVKNDAPEAVALCGTVQDSSLLINQLRAAGVDAFLMGGTSLYNSKALELAGDNMEGVGCISVYISSNPDKKVQDFVKKYNDKYGETPDAFAAMAYDEAYVFAAACGHAMENNDGELTREGIQEALKDTKYTGVTGTVTYDDTNEWVRDYLVLEVKDGAFTLAGEE